MTTISRARFISDLSSHQIPARDMSASLGNVGSQEIDALSGSDHVFNTREELGALYDKLVALDRADRERGGSSNLDRANAVYERYAQAKKLEHGTGAAVPLVPAASSDRARSTGVNAPAPRILLPAPQLASNASYVRTLARMNAAELAPQAERNVIGPAASAQKVILAEGERVARRIEALEARRSQPGADRDAIAAEIELEKSGFELTVATQRGAARSGAGAAGSEDPMKKLTRKLPPYIRSSLEQEGITIPKVPGAFRPDRSLRGAEWRIKF